MLNALPKLNPVTDRIIFAAVNTKACICYNGPGLSSDQFCSRTGEKSNLFIEKQAEGQIGSDLTLRAFDLNYYQAQELLRCFAHSIGEVIEPSASEILVERDLALRPIFTFRCRDLNVSQVAKLVHKRAEL